MTVQKRITSAAVRNLCGGISDMTLWRWLNDEKLGFPKPSYIGRRRYWIEAQIVDWLASCPRSNPAHAAENA